MKLHFAVAALTGLALVSGCRRHPAEDPDSITGAPRPAWSTSEVTTAEGKKLTLTLNLVQPSTQPVDVHLATDAAGIVDFPDVVSFTAGSTSRSVTVTALAAEPGPTRDPEIIATTANGSSTVTIHILDDDGDLGLAVGPVVFSTGVVVFAGAGTDLVFGTPDDEIVAAKNIGAGAPVFTRTVAGTFSGGAECVPVAATGSVLSLAIGIAPTIVQVQSVPDAPAVTASLVLPAKLGGVSRPVMIGTRAVITSRGNDLFTSGDDNLLIVEGIGTTTLTVKTVPMPGLSAGDPSIPVQLTATSLLITSAGPDFLFGTGDEALVLVSAIDTPLPVITPLFSGFIRGDASGRALASGGTIAAVTSAGADVTFSTADDELQVIRDVLGTPAPAFPALVVGAVLAGDAGLPLSTGGDAAVVPTLGLDLLPGTSDDEVVAVFPLSTDPMTATVLAASRGVPGPAGALVLVSGSVVVRLDSGPDGGLGNSDDCVRILTMLDSATPDTTSLVSGPLQAFAPMAADAGTVVLCGEGSDSTAGTGDDLTIRLAGIGGSSTFSSNPTGAFAPLSTPVLVLGTSGSSVAARTAGPDGVPGTADDRLSVAKAP